MPTFEFCCDNCGVLFEETFIDPDETKKYREEYPCIQCDRMARRVMSATNFQFKGVPGQSGSHDLDYPILDKAVGRSAANKWQRFYKEKERRDKVRQDSGQHAVTQIGDSITPTPASNLKIREHYIKKFNEAKSK